MTKTIHPGNFETFMEVYSEKLREAITAYPSEYAWPHSELETVLKKMRAAIEHGTFNKDSRAFKATCKALKLKHTYKAIQEFICL